MMLHFMEEKKLGQKLFHFPLQKLRNGQKLLQIRIIQITNEEIGTLTES